MKKFKIVAVVCCALALCLALVGCGPNKQSYMGTWDLEYCETIDTEEMGGVEYTEEQMTALRESAGLDIYLTLTDNDIALFDVLGAVSNGKWAMEGSNATIEFNEMGMVDPETGEVQPVNKATLSLNGDTLTMDKDNTRYIFKKGEDKNPYDPSEDIIVANEDGLSIMIDEGEKLANPVTVVDDDNVSIIIDGIGVDSVGDPGYNVQIVNKTADPINVWIPEVVKVGDKEIRVNIYQSLNPTQSTTTFIQFAYDDLGSSNPEDLQDVYGEFQVDNALTGEIIGTYAFEL